MRPHISKVRWSAQMIRRGAQTVVIARKVEGVRDSARYCGVLAVDSPHWAVSTNAATPTEPGKMSHHRRKSMRRQNAPRVGGRDAGNPPLQMRFTAPELLQFHIHGVTDLEGAR
jgi:hypothetical protein